MPSQFAEELANFPTTYTRALSADIGPLKTGIVSASESSIICVGSGGSFTVASLFCNLHEVYTGRVSRPSTPLEIICNPTLAAASPIFFISAEGKNPDIVDAFTRARERSARHVHIITNRSASPLIDRSSGFTDINTHVFELAEKDGYLATNSLLLDSVVVARAYQELDRHEGSLPTALEELRLADLTIPQWLAQSERFVDETVRRGAVIVVHSPALKPLAADFESKASESALLHCQLTDLRSFAHGRHLWLSGRRGDVAVLALIEPATAPLWRETSALFPPTVPQLVLQLEGATPRDLIAGLIAQMSLLSLIADKMGLDPATPDIPDAARRMYYMDLDGVVRVQNRVGGKEDIITKFGVLGARWPLIPRQNSMQRAADSFRQKLCDQTFRAIVFDYDGTLCSSDALTMAPPQNIIAGIRLLIDGGITVGIASGRGGSVQEELRTRFAESDWTKIQLALYNGGWLGNLSEEIPQSPNTSEFLSHVVRIISTLRAAGAPIEVIRPTHPFHVSIRFRDGIDAGSMWFVIADALRQAGVDTSTTVRSKHSVDVLSRGISKSNLITHIIQNMKIDPYRILTMGDQGSWPGNDSALMDHHFSLSVATPSRKLDRGWKFAPANKRNVDAAAWYLERLTIGKGGTFRLSLSEAGS